MNVHLYIPIHSCWGPAWIIMILATKRYSINIHNQDHRVEQHYQGIHLQNTDTDNRLNYTPSSENDCDCVFDKQVRCTCNNKTHACFFAKVNCHRLIKLYHASKFAVLILCEWNTWINAHIILLVSLLKCNSLVITVTIHCSHRPEYHLHCNWHSCYSLWQILYYQ